MNYDAVNAALRQAFGGDVELRRATGKEYEFTLWFRDDNPSPQTINQAKLIVSKFAPTNWYDDLAFHS